MRDFLKKNENSFQNIVKVIFLSMLMFGPEKIFAATYNVTNTNDTGEGSLREAIANAVEDGDIIDLSSIVGGGIITLESDLPSISHSITITNGEDPVAIVGFNGQQVFNVSSGTVLIEDNIDIQSPLVKIGAGTLNFLGTNSSSETTISVGTLSVSSDTSLGNPEGGLTIEGGTLQWSDNASSSRDVVLLDTASTINVASEKTVTMSGVFSSTGAFTKAGEGTLVLSGENTYEGNTTISMGSLVVANDSNLGNSMGTVTFSGGSLVWTGSSTSSRDMIISEGSDGLIDTGSSTITLTGNITGSSGALTKEGVGTLVLSGANTYAGAVVSEGTLKVTGTNSLSGDTSIAQEAILELAQTEATTVSGVISGSGSVRKTDSGTLILSAANTYTGGTTLSDGVLSIAADASLGNVSGTLTFSGGTLAFTGSNETSRSIAISDSSSGTIDTGNNIITFTGDITGSSGALTKEGVGTLVLSGANTYANAVVSEGTLKVTGTNSLSGDTSIAQEAILELAQTEATTVSGVISGSGSVRKTDSGTLILSAANTYTGGTSISAGTISVTTSSNLGANSSTISFDGGTLAWSEGSLDDHPVALGENGGAINVADSYTTTMTGVFSSTGTLTKKGAGTLVLSDSNTYTGGTVIDEGTITVSSNSGLGDASSGITFNGGTLNLNSGITSNRSIDISDSSNATISTGSNTVTLSGNIIGSSGTLTKEGIGTLVLSGANSYGTAASQEATIISAGTLKVTGATSLSGNTSIASDAMLDFAQMDETIYSNNLSGSGSVTKSGGGTLTLSGTNTFAGGINFNAGTIVVGSNTALGNSSSNITFNGGSLEWTGSDSSGRDVALYASGGTIKTATDVTTTMSGVISSTGTLTKTGDGTLSLTGINTYTGGTIVSTGTLVANGDAALGNSTGTLQLLGSTLSWTDTTDSSRDVTITGSSTVNTDSGTTVTMSGVISASGNLAKKGEGILTLTADNTYIGGTTVRSGTLKVAADKNLGNTVGGLTLGAGTLQWTESATSARAATLIDSATISIDSGAIVTMSGVFSSTGSVTKSGEGTLVLSGANTYSGGTILGAGNLNVAADTALGHSSGALTFAGGSLTWTDDSATARSVTVSDSSSGSIDTGSHTVTFSGNITGNSASITKSGSGTLVLSGANNFAETTEGAGLTISEGNVKVAGVNSLSGNTVVSSSAILDFAQTDATTYSNVISGSGSVAKTGSGALTLSGVNTFTGGLMLSNGTVNVSSDTALGNLSGTVTFNGGTLAWTETASSDRAITITDSNSATIDTGSNTVTFSGNIIGSSSTLTKTGTGTLALTGSNNYGSTAISAGTLKIAESQSLSGNTSISSGATLEFAQTADVSYDDEISGAGSVTKTGSGALTLSGNNIFTGGATVADGTIKVAADSALGDSSGNLTFAGGSLNWTGSTTSSRSVVLSSNATITTASETAVTMSGDISGTGALTKAGEGSLTLSASNTYSGGTTISSGTIIVPSDTALGSSAGSLTFSGGDLAWTNSTSSNRSVVILNDATIRTYEDAAVTMSGNFSGMGSLSKTGDGTLILSAANTYDGGTTIMSGTISASSDEALGDSAAALSISAGTMAWTGSTSSSRSTALLSSNSVIDTAEDTTITMSGVLSSSGKLNKKGEGTLVLSAENTYTGGTVLDEGTISIADDTSLGNSSGTVTFGGGTLAWSASKSTERSFFISDSRSGTINTGDSTVTLSGNITGNSGSFTKKGAGKLVLSGFNTYGQATTGVATNILEGTLTVTGESSLSGNTSISSDATLEFAQSSATSYAGTISGSGSITKTGSGVLTLSEVNTYAGGTTITDGKINVGADTALGSAGSTLTFDGGTLAWTADNTSARSVNINNGSTAIIDTNSHTVTFSGNITGSSGSLTKLGSGTLTLSGTNNYAATTTSAGLTVSEGTVKVMGATSLSGSAIVSENTALDFAQTDAATYSNTISGAGAVRKTGSGKLTLSNDNTFTGGLTLTNGTVSVATDTALGSSAGLLVLNGGSLQWTASNESTRDVDLDADSVISVDSEVTVTMSGAFNSSGRLTKSGSGALVLTGANTYTGGTEITDGTLIISDDIALGNSTGAITLGNGTLEWTAAVNSSRDFTLSSSATGTLNTNSHDITLSGNIVGSSHTLVKIGTGTLILTGSNNYESTTLSSGSIKGTGAESISGNINAALGTSVEFAQTDDVTYSSSLSGSGALVKTGNGGLTLAGSNSYTGGTSLISGNLKAIGANSLTGDIVTSADTTIDLAQTETTTYSGNITGSGALLKSGSAVVTLSGVNTYTGGTTISGGTLQIYSDENLGDGESALVINGGSLVGLDNFTTARNASFNNNSVFEALEGKEIRISGKISGDGSITKTGNGFLELNNDDSTNYNGTIYVEAGEFKLNAPIGGGVTVTGGKFSGTGDVGGSMIVNSGSFAPGNSIGTIIVNGDFELNGTSTYFVQLNEDPDCTLTDVSGTATIASTALLDVTSLTGYFYTGADGYTILTADGGITGYFSENQIVTNNLVMAPTTYISGNDLKLSFTTSFLRPAITNNQWYVGQQLQSITDPTSEQQTILNELSSIDGIYIRESYNQMSGQQYNNLLVANEKSKSRFMRAMFNNIRSIVTTPVDHREAARESSIWIDGSVQRGFYGNNREATGFRSSGGLATLNALAPIGRSWTLGGSVGYEKEHIRDRLNATSAGSRVLAGFSALYRADGGYFMADLMGGYSETRMLRVINVHSLHYNASSKPRALETALYLEAGADINIKKVGLLVQPFFGIENAFHNQRFTQESGAGPASLALLNRSYFTSTGRAGLHLSTTQLPWGLKVALDGAYNHRFTNPQTKLKARFAEFGGAFEVRGIGMSKDSCDASLTISERFTDAFEMYVQANGEVGNHAVNYGASVGITAWL